MMLPNEIIVDSFAGGGGASLGLSWAIGRDPDIAINHDRAAMAMYAANHPHTELHPENVWHVDPVKACRGRPVGLMWLSPDCTQFSKAKGGKPVKKKLRGLAWTAVRWASKVRPRIICLENVEEFEDWGPLYPADHPVKKLRNRPIPKHKGRTFRAFVAKLRRLGYEVEWRQLRACDLGAPTIRRRLFLVARCDGRPIVWPTPTYGKGRQHPFHTAAECIDWDFPCPSIFMTEEEARALAKATGIKCVRPLKPATLRRIARGMFKFVIDNPQPFIVSNMNNNVPRGIDEPLSTILSGNHKYLASPHLTKFRTGSTGSQLSEPMPTVTANSFDKRPGGAAPLGLVSPVVVPIDHRGSGDAGARQAGEPLSTITAENRHAIAVPFLSATAHQDDSQRAHSLEEPLRTITASRRGDEALIAPTLIQRYGEREGQAPRANTVEAPLNTVVPTGNGGDLVQAFLAKHYGGHETPGSACNEPIGTLTTQDHHHLVAAHLQRDFGRSVGADMNAPVPTVTPGGGGKTALVTSFVTKYHGTARDGQQLTLPFPAILAQGNHLAEVRAFLYSYYSGGQAKGDLNEPMGSVTGRDRFGLVTVHGVEYAIVDIGMRMLQPRELFRAQGFPDSYAIDGIWFDAQQFRRKKGKKVRVLVHRELTKTEKVRMCGNSVPPVFARDLALANYVERQSAEEANVA